MATIASLIVDISANTVQLQKDVKQIHGQLDTVGSVAGTVGKALAGAFTIGAVVSFAKEIASFASDMNDLSARTGIGVERLQAFNYVGAGAGVTVEQLADGVAQLSRRLIEGNAGAVGAVERLGLNVERLITMEPDKAFIAIAEAVSRIQNPMERNAIAMELFGKSGAKFLPLLTDDLGKLVEAAEKSGAVMSKELIEKSDKVDDMFAQLWIRTKALTGALIEQATLDPPWMVWAKSLVTYASAGNSAADIMDKLTKKTSALAVDGLKPVSVSMKEVDEITKKLNTSIAQQIEKSREAAEAAEKWAENLAWDQAWTDMHADAAAAMEIWTAATNKATTAQIELAMTMRVTLQNQSDLTAGLIYGAQAITSQSAATEGYAYQAVEAQRRTEEWYASVYHLADGFNDLGRIIGGSMGRALDHISAMTAGVANAKAGIGQLKTGFGALSSGNILSGLGGIVSGIGGIASAAQAAIAIVMGLWNGLKKLFGGGEEGTVVNPARDTFFGQFVDQFGGTPFEAMAAAFTSAGVDGNVAERMIKRLYDANTMALFKPAAQAIVDTLTAGGVTASMNFHRGGMVPGSGEVNATLLGGERVQTREEVQMFRRLHEEIAGLRREMGRNVGRAVADAMNGVRLRTA